MRSVCVIALSSLAAACGDDFEVDSSSWCGRGGGPVDVVVLGSKAFADVCYNPLVANIIVTDSAAPFPQTGTDATVTFDSATNGQPIVGDVTVDGDFVTIFGNGADSTIIDGNFIVTGGNARIRGITVRGTLTFRQSNGAIVSSRVGGDVVITNDSTLVSQDDIFGSITASSKRNLFVDDRVQGAWSPGARASCAGNVSFADTNGDGVAQDSEVTGDLSC
jgi:hypothetical protein